MQLNLTCSNCNEQTLIKARNKSDVANKTLTCEHCGAVLPRIANQQSSDPREQFKRDPRNRRPL